MPNTTRRNFLATSSAALVGSGVSASMMPNVHVRGCDEIKVVLVGCGAAALVLFGQIFNTKGNVRLVAVADAFREKAENSVASLRKHAEGKVDVTAERIFTGLDAYKRAIDSDCDLVVIATPPGFKPQQFEYAVSKGKTSSWRSRRDRRARYSPRARRGARVEEEEPDGRRWLQRRHEPKYMETMKRVHDGAIGDVILSRVYWNGGGIWYRKRRPNQSEMGFQCNNWYHFNWICGDQIVEQHIHNLDVGCWAKNAYPVKCNGMGGREMRMGGDATKSQINDHTFCEYTFADGTKMYSKAVTSVVVGPTLAKHCMAPRARGAWRPHRRSERVEV